MAFTGNFWCLFYIIKLDIVISAYTLHRFTYMWLCCMQYKHWNLCLTSCSNFIYLRCPLFNDKGHNNVMQPETWFPRALIHTLNNNLERWLPTNRQSWSFANLFGHHSRICSCSSRPGAVMVHHQTRRRPDFCSIGCLEGGNPTTHRLHPLMVLPSTASNTWTHTLDFMKKNVLQFDKRVAAKWTIISNVIILTIYNS